MGLLRWLAGAIVVVVPTGYFAYKEFDNVTHQIKGYSFSETLPKMADREGDDSRVVSVLVRDRNVFFAVLDEDGRVRERFYGEVCTKETRGSACAYREQDGERSANAVDRKLAQATLDELDPGVVERIRDEADVGKEVPIGLRGRRWVVGSFDPKVAAITDLDGSNLHRAKTPAELALAKSVAEDPGR